MRRKALKPGDQIYREGLVYKVREWCLEGVWVQPPMIRSMKFIDWDEIEFWKQAYVLKEIR